MSKHYSTARVVGLLLILACLFSCKPSVYQFTATLTSIEEREHRHVRGFPPGAWTSRSWILTFDNGRVVEIKPLLSEVDHPSIGDAYSVLKGWAGYELAIVD